MFVGHAREKRLLDMKLVFYLNGVFPCYFCPAFVFFVGVGAERARPNIWGPEGMTGHFA